MDNIRTSEFVQDGVCDVVTVDQVCCVSFTLPGAHWRMGSTCPDWEQHLPLTATPSQEELAALDEREIWLQRAGSAVPPLAVTCCGQGSVWPGMGRDLYEYFPEARQAMDRIAACANWDVLALMDEPDVETIGLTQWVQPYLFLLEYAQYSLLLARGLKPAVICGHSLGELIALCLAGVYSPETCWYILETRSRQVAEMEARSRRDTGMMGVYGSLDEVKAVLDQCPGLHVSNYNTPTQFILSGSRDVLQKARRHLRKRRVPAVILNIAMAFHHPNMRVLRDMSWQRLMMFDMHGADMPMLSCVTAREYPRDQVGICTSIMDLDENTVNWVQTVNALADNYGARHFLELGPSDTLCGMTEAVRPGSFCLACDSRTRERDAMRQVLARLYALGHLEHGVIRQVAASVQPLPPLPPRPPFKETGVAIETDTESEVTGNPVLRGLLAAACGRPVEELRGSMDLRFDLRLRSSSFPSLIGEATKALGVDVPFERLLSVATIADLERAFSPDSVEEEDRSAYQPLGTDVQRAFMVMAAADAGTDELPEERPQHPARQAPAIRTCAVRGEDDALCAQLVRCLAATGTRFALDRGLEQTRAAVCSMGGSADISWQAFTAGTAPCDLFLWQGGFDDAAIRRLLLEDKVRCDKVVFAGPPESRGQLAACLALAGQDALAILFERAGCADTPAGRTQLGDLLLRELREGSHGLVRWCPDEKAQLLVQPMLDDAMASPLVFPERAPSMSRRTPCTEWNAQFSPEVCPGLEALPADADGWRVLPLALLLEAQRQTSLLASPGLAATGFVDIRPMGQCLVRRGVVREMRLVADIRPWLAHDRVMTRMCRVRPFLREMTRGGRSSSRHVSMGESVVLLAGRDPGTAPLWVPDVPGQGQAVDLDAWYEAAGIGAQARWLEDAQIVGRHGFSAVLRESVFVAFRAVHGYNILPYGHLAHLDDGTTRHTSAFAGVLQAVDAARAADTPRTQCDLFPGFVGFVRFGSAAQPPFTVSVRRRWDQDRVLRYDAQVTDAAGACLLAINHIEFNELAQGGDGQLSSSGSTLQGA